jgi:hypothetical protein
MNPMPSQQDKRQQHADVLPLMLYILMFWSSVRRVQILAAESAIWQKKAPPDT